MKISIIIPCFNERNSLEDLISQITFLQKNYEVEFILIENGSIDDSKEFFIEIEGKHKNIQIVFVDQNRGYGYGIQQGLKIAHGEYIGWVHSDLQVSLLELKKFFNCIKVLNPSKKIFMKGRRMNRSYFDLFFTTGQSLFNTILFGYRFEDVGAAPTIFSKSLVGDIEAMPNDFSIELFMYLQAMKNEYIIKRIPVVLVERKTGNSSWNLGIKSKLLQSKRIINNSLLIKRNKKVL